MNIHGQAYSREDLLRHCNPSVLYGARKIEIAEGRGRGHRLIEVKTASGLHATFSEDKCLDIIDLSYKGVNLGFLSKNGIVSTPIANPETNSFTKYWPGGFLSTCGLRNTGRPNEVNGEFFPLHGHVSLTPGENVCVNVNEKEITISGKVRETALFGHCLEMERKITIPSDGAEIAINDTVYNLTPEEEPVLLLYHINFGFPFLSEHLELKFPECEVRGNTSLAQEKISERTKITPPSDGAEELVYFYTPKEKDVKVNLANRKLNISTEVSYDSTQLPVLAQWKCMRSGDYALGIEPGTSYLKGRKGELESGYNIKVPGFGKLEFGVTISVGNHE